MSLVLNSSSGGSITINEPNTASNVSQTLVATTGTLAPIVSGTAKASTSGTSVDFSPADGTGVPAWVRKITVMFQGVGTNSTSPIQIQVGSGTYTTTGYVGAAVTFGGAAGASFSSPATGFVLEVAVSPVSASTLRNGIVTLALISGNTWVASGFLGHTGTTSSGATGGYVSLSGVLDRLRIIGTGSNTFNAGTINVIYE